MAVVRANYVKRGKDERATAKANLRYIQERPGRDKEKLTRTLFGLNIAKLSRTAKGQHFAVKAYFRQSWRRHPEQARG
jgi:hypothetical protein